MPIRLPKEPKDHDYEDFVASCVLSLGYFVESNLTLKEEGTEVAELDLVATPIVNPVDDVTLIDAKSGKTGFPDLFKISGIKGYLDIPSACIVRSTTPDEAKIATFDRVAQRTGVRVAIICPSGDFEFSDVVAPAIDLNDELRSAFCGAAWFGRIARRLAFRKLLDHCKAHQTEAVMAAKQYRWAIEDSFFAKRPIDRAKRLYAAYKESPNISGCLVNDLAGEDDKRQKKEWTKIRDTEERGALQRALMMEHSARIRIIKNALLHIRIKEQGGDTRTLDWSELVMPKSFLTGLKALHDRDYADRIPYLFQIFIEVFGGFYSLCDDRDLAALEQYTGIPKDDIPAALRLFNDFFPISNGWFVDAKNKIRMMKMTPAIARGTGAFLRRQLHGDKLNYDDIYPEMGWLVSKWHNALYRFLEPELKT